MVIYILRHEKGPFKLDIKHLQIARPELRKVLQIGFAGIQGMVFSIANIFIQAAVNRFGSTAIAGSAAPSRTSIIAISWSALSARPR
ncbi:MAG: hypothetical protein ACLTZT_03065 [Butyricimonas faecalis]